MESRVTPSRASPVIFRIMIRGYTSVSGAEARQLRSTYCGLAARRRHFRVRRRAIWFDWWKAAVKPRSLRCRGDVQACVFLLCLSIAGAAPDAASLFRAGAGASRAQAVCGSGAAVEASLGDLARVFTALSTWVIYISLSNEWPTPNRCCATRQKFLRVSSMRTTSSA